MPEENEANQAKSAYFEATQKKIRPPDMYRSDKEVGRVYLQMVVKKHGQVPLKSGLQRFGKDGEKAVKKEIRSFMDFNVLNAIVASELTRQKKIDALPLIMILKEKRSGEVKARGVAGGHKDRGKIPPEDATSPTASTEALYISSAVDAFERRFVGLLDIPSSYFHALAGDRINSVVVLEGVLVDLYVQVDPTVASKIHYSKNGKKHLYARMNKALHGHIMSGRLFLEHLSGILVDMGFSPNTEP